MALTLAAELPAPTPTILPAAANPALTFRVTGTVPATVDLGYRFRLGDELLEIRSFGRMDVPIANGYATQNVRDLNLWTVTRGLEDTVAVSHGAGTAVLGSADAWVAGPTDVPPEPWAGGGGGGTSDHTALTPESRAAADQHPATAITVDPAVLGNPNAQAALEGLAIAVGEAGDGSLLLTQDQKDALDNANAPDASNAVATLADTGLPAVLLRDPSTGGETIIHEPAVDLPANVDAIATATGTGPADARKTANSVDGVAQGGSLANTSGSGTADTRAIATASGAGDADAGPEAFTVDGAAIAAPTATSTGTGATDARPQATGVDGTAQAGSVAITTGDGDARAGPLANTVDGDAQSTPIATATGTGAANVRSTATTDTGDALAGSRAIRDGVTAGTEAIVDGDGPRLTVHAGNGVGLAGEALVSNGATASWGGVPSAAEVPSGAPTGLPFEYDTTAVTGGMYFWNGAAWVKITTIL